MASSPDSLRPDVHSLAGRLIAVPGSTSNLGAAFDAAGLALRIALRIRITSVADDGRGDLRCQFSAGPLEGDNAIALAFRHGVETFASPAAGPPSLDVNVDSEIPMRAGLGSSAAALVAGLRLAELVTAPQPTTRLLTAACALEGHPDNTSASLLGGFVVACRLGDGSVLARSTAWPEAWPLVIGTPAVALETSVARAALAPLVPFEDAVFNLQRVALLVDAVHRRDPATAHAAFADRLHQPRRAPLVPGLEHALSWSEDGLLGVFLSGAGPSIAAVVNAGVPGAVPRVEERFAALYQRLGLPATIRVLQAHEPLDQP